MSNNKVMVSPHYEKGQPKTLKNMAPIQVFGVQFVDTDGKVKTGLVLKMNDHFYMSKNYEQEMENLGPVKSWLGKALAAREEAQKQASRAPQLPKQDTVDVLGG